MTLTLPALRACLDSSLPASLATVDADGVPNLAHVAQLRYVDEQTLALPWQFFSKTRRNLVANATALLAVTDPRSACQYRLRIEYLRTDTSGALFDSMAARQAALASHLGLGDMLPLRGADLCRVHAIERVPGLTLPEAAPRRNLLAAMRSAAERLQHDNDPHALLNDTLDCLVAEFDVQHAIALLYDSAAQQLLPTASRGYGSAAPASPIALGEGVIGSCARARNAIRIGHMTSEYAYHRAIRASTVACGFGEALDPEIPLPGLADARSQLAVPMLAGPLLVGVLYLESPFDLRFGPDDEDAMAALAAQLGMALQAMPALQNGALAPAQEALLVRHFLENDSIFLGDDYLIKGVAGSIFAALVADFIDNAQVEFTNRALRLDTRIRLPDLSDNLEGRLLLLSRRLAEKGAGIHIEKTGRGRFRLCSERPLKLAAAR
jgi:adenylate cyclase